MGILTLDGVEFHWVYLDPILPEPLDRRFDGLGLSLELQCDQADLMRDRGVADVEDQVKATAHLPEQRLGGGLPGKGQPEAALFFLSA